MVLPTPPSNSTTPIPNDPFYWPQQDSINSSAGPLIAGSGIAIDYTTGVISATGGGGGGGIPCSCIIGKGSLITGSAPNSPVALSVGPNGYALVSDSTCLYGLKWSALPPAGITSICTGTGLTGGPITTSGTIALSNTTVVAGNYSLSNITVDSQGRITSASNGTAVTSITAGGGLTGGTITNVGTIALGPTTVTPGSYTFASITVDACGRLTAAGDGNAPSTTVTAPLVNSGTAIDPILSISPASTSACGAVQLYNGLDSNSSCLALTAAQGRILQQQITSLTSGGTIFAGTLNASTGLMVDATAAGISKGFISGQTLPAPAAGNTDYYVIVSVGGTYDPPGPGGPYVATIGDWFISTGSAYSFLDLAPSVPYASTTVPGLICLSTNTLAAAGVDNTTALTPSIGKCTYVQNCNYTGKGVILGGSSAPGTPVPLGVGADGSILTACSACPSGLTWGAGGSVIIPTATQTTIGGIYGCTNGGSNTALGFRTGVFGTLGYNTFVGYYAGNQAGACASGNTAVGFYSMGCGPGGTPGSGGSNTAIGSEALLYTGTNTLYNVAVGVSALCTATPPGCGNVAIGAGAGGGYALGNFNVLIGPNVNAPAVGCSCVLAIGYATGQHWLTGDSSKNIRPGAGLRDCTGALGTAGQVLTSTGTALQWKTFATPGQGVSGICDICCALVLDNLMVRLCSAGAGIIGPSSFQIKALTTPFTATWASCGVYTTTGSTTDAYVPANVVWYCCITTGTWVNLYPSFTQCHGSTLSATICYGDPVTAAYAFTGMVGYDFLKNILCLTRIV